MNDNKNVMLITGGSGGIGKATAELYADNGFIVYEISRSGQSTNKISHLSADITKPNEVKAAIDTIINEQGKIDILINNAGFGISGAVEFTDIEMAKKQFDVNFFGTVTVINAVIPYMRQNGKGRIINLSSVAGVLSIPFQCFYSAAKASINSLTLALVNELKPFNISVTALMPGDIHTGFTKNREKSIIGDDVYNGRIGRSVSVMEKDETNGMKPQYIANCLYKLGRKRKVKPLYSAGFKYKFFCVLAKLLPCSLSNKIVGSIYSK